MAFGGSRSSWVRPGAHSARHQDSRNDWTPYRMAWPFVSTGAHAPHSDEMHDPTATRGSSHSARRLRSLAFLCSSAEAGNPPRPRHPGTCGRVRQSPAGNLIRQLRERRNKVLRFLTDLRVPFDNNPAERDLRMPKLKQKVPGCFRSNTSTEDFAIIRSYLSTRRKQSDDMFNLLVLTTFQGPLMSQSS